MTDSAALYAGADLTDPMKPGLTRVDDKPYPGAHLNKVARESAVGGLVSTLGDMVRLLQRPIRVVRRCSRRRTIAEMSRT